MAGNGPPPSQTRSRTRDNAQRDMLRSNGKISGYNLPDDVLPMKSNDPESPDYDVREDWHPQTVRWWNNWRESPQASRMLTMVDWDYMLDTALLHHQMWQSGGKNSERAAEIRMRVAAFGATLADRLRLRQEIEVPPEEYPTGTGKTGRGNVTSLDERRAALGG